MVLPDKGELRDYRVIAYIYSSLSHSIFNLTGLLMSERIEALL